MKQSSIEFAVTSLEKLIPSGNQLVVGAILLQAKEMHKEEMKEMFLAGITMTDSDMSDKYYNETFNTQ